MATTGIGVTIRTGGRDAGGSIAEVAQSPQVGTLTDRINAEHQACLAAAVDALEHALEAGRLLAEVKAALPHGAFGPWVDAHFEGSDRSARGYMRLYACREELSQNGNTVATLSLRDALKALSAPRPQGPPPVPGIVQPTTPDQERRQRARDRAVQRLRDRAELAIRTGNHERPADLSASPTEWDRARWEAVQAREQNIPNVLDALAYELHILTRHADPEAVARYFADPGNDYDLAELREGAAWLHEVIEWAEG